MKKAGRMADGATCLCTAALAGCSAKEEGQEGRYGQEKSRPR